MTWETIQLGEFITLKRGYDLPSSHRVDGPVPVVSSSGVTGHHNVAKIRAPGVVTGRYGTLGEVFFVRDDFWPLNTSLYVQDFKGNDPRFSGYFLGSVLTKTNSDKAAVPGVNRNDLHALAVRVTRDIGEQRAIASVLSAYDDLIENNRRRIQLLEQDARLLYEEWFVRLRFPGHKHVTITDGVPEGWEYATVGEKSTLVRGRSYRSSNLVESDGKPFVNLKCIARHGGFRLDGLKRFAGQYKSHQIVSAGDIVIALTDMTRERHIVAHAARVPAAMNEDGVLSMDIVKVNPGDAVDKSWFYYFLRYSGFSKEVRESATGTNVLHLKPKQIEDYEFRYPPRLLQARFGEVVHDIVDQQDNLTIQNERLAQTRDLVLPRLMNGEVAV